jgi:hypothetical protein
MDDAIAGSCACEMGRIADPWDWLRVFLGGCAQLDKGTTSIITDDPAVLAELLGR